MIRPTAYPPALAERGTGAHALVRGASDRQVPERRAEGLGAQQPYHGGNIAARNAALSPLLAPHRSAPSADSVQPQQSASSPSHRLAPPTVYHATTSIEEWVD